VRAGESYDGRAPKKKTGAAALRVVPRAALFLPRIVLAVLLRTAVAATDWLERSGTLSLIRRVFWPWDGRLRILPVGGYRSDLASLAGGTVATDLLFGPRHRAGLEAVGSGGDPEVWMARLRIHPLGLALPGRPPLPGRWRLVLDGGYQTRDDVPFRTLGYLRGPPDEDIPVVQYRREVAHGHAGVAVRAWRRLRLRLRLGYEWRRFSDGERNRDKDYDPFSERFGTRWPGWRQGLGGLRADLQVAWGGRLGRLLPDRGIRAVLGASLWAGKERAARLVGLSADVEAFVTFGGGYRRLGVRGRARALTGLHGQAVPLVYLPRLGGLRTMRGFSGGWLQGESVAWLALEYYAALHPRLWLCLFLDWGGAWREWFTGRRRDWWDRVDVAGGGWMALRIAPWLWLQLQVAGSREGPQVFIGWRMGS
jgi:hypothetical protein